MKPAEWSFACPDWRERIKSGRSLVPDLPLDRKAADRAIKVFDRLHIPDVIGTPLMRDAAGDWVREIIAALFGSIDPASGRRRVREPFLMVPKKNAKTTNASAIMLTALLLNERPYAEFLLVAPTQEIAQLAFRAVEGMIAADKFLSMLLHVQEHKKTITHQRNSASLKIKSFSADVLTGVRPSGILLDELHVVSGNPNADRVIGQLRGGLISQPEGFLFFITTQSERPPSGVFKSELTKARAIRDGLIPGAMLPILYEFPENVAWTDPHNWWMVTPNRDRSITIDRLIEEYDTARESGDAELRRWASQHLNVEIGLALRTDAWPGAEYWEANVEFGLTLRELIRRSDLATIGIDGGGLDDLLGVAVVGRDRETRQWLAWTHAYAHVSVLDRRKAEAAKLRDFERDGDLEIVAKVEHMFAGVADIAAEVDAAGILAQVGLDPYGVAKIVEAMAERGIKGDDRVAGVSQGYKLQGTIKTAEGELADGNLRHAGSAMMSWCVGNARVEPKGNGIIITKQASGSAKIDPLMALFNAVALLGQLPELPDTQSVYDREDRGLLIL